MISASKEHGRSFLIENSIKLMLIILILFWSFINSFGQVSIKGKIKDPQQNLTNATVLLLRSDSSRVKGAFTDSLGEFIFENVLPGNYRLSSSAVGYTEFFSDLISVQEKNITLQDILLDKSKIELGEVLVKSKKPLYEQKIDRLTVNVQNSISLSGNTILEVLQKSPGIVVNRQNNSINMNGKSGVRVMINNKMIRLPLEAVVQMLDGMSSSNVEKIELIHTPSSKYDAEGNAGIIHIILKERADLGTNGSLGLTVGYRWAENLGGNFNLNHRSKKFSFFLDYSVLRNHNMHVFKMDRRLPHDAFLETVDDHSRRENITTQQDLNAGAEWNLTHSTSLNLSVTAYRRNWDLTALANEYNRHTVDSNLNTDMKIHESNIWQSATVGMGTQTKIDQRQTLSLNLDYLYYHNSNPSQYDTRLLYESSNVYEFSKIDLRKITPISFLVGSLDYQYNPSSSWAWEAGLKAVTSSLDNDVSVDRFLNNNWIRDSFFSSSSTLNEQSGAAYVSAKWQAGSQWQLNGGFRYEYTHTTLSTPAIKNILDRKYGYLFPSFFVRKDFKQGEDVQFSYSRRITRPTYNDIAPWVFFWDPGTFSAGNTSLLPAVSDAIKADFHERQWIISIQFSHSKNEISFLQPEIDTQSNYLIYRSQNMKYLNTVGLTNTLSSRLTYWWQLQTNITGQYQFVRTAHLSNNNSIRLFNFNVSVINSIALPKDFSIEISGSFQSKSFWGISYFLPTGSLNAGIQKKIGERGVLRFAMDDILRTNYWKFKTYLPQNKLDTHFIYDFHNQYARVTYTRTFGNAKLKTIKQKSGSEEERKRVGN